MISAKTLTGNCENHNFHTIPVGTKGRKVVTFKVDNTIAIMYVCEITNELEVILRTP